MAILQHFVVCESSAVDKMTNRASYFNVLEQITATQFPAALQHCTAVALLMAEDADYGVDFQLVVRLVRPGEPDKDFPLNFRFEEGHHRHRLSFNFSPVSVQEAGEFKLQAILNGQLLAEHVVTVQRGEAPARLREVVAVPDAQARNAADQ